MTQPSTSETIKFAQELIRIDSVTPNDAGCQQLLAKRLTALGFHCEHLRFGEGHSAGPVDNLWAVKGTEGPLFCFAGHTDVVPVGKLDNWTHQPFSADIENGMLVGRGAADMKGSIAAMTVAVEKFLAKHKNHQGRIAFLITSDEEGPSLFGTAKVMEYLEQKKEKITWCLFGEPSSTDQLGDVVKNGRRGSLSAYLTVKGIQGHVAYPQRAKNPIHLVLPALQELTQREWDKGNEFFPATSFQISNINSGTGAGNVIPGEITVAFNLRFSTVWTATQLQNEIENTLKKYQLDYSLRWEMSNPFLTAKGALVNAAVAAIKEHTGLDTQLLTTGGTSDGRFIAPTGAEVVELGPINATIHKIDECVSIKDLETLEAIYLKILENLLARA
jgi:succinyl-diaminopimelate desuccinylase